MWNDTDEPLAYFITFRTHGTWLHGDERRSVSRHVNKFDTPKIRPQPVWLEKNKSRLKGEPVILNGRQRACVKKAIRETCRIRSWVLSAINVRTNHVHVVVIAPNKGPSLVLNAFKANSTSIMRQRGLWIENYSPWVDKGSTRYIWNEKSMATVCNFVINGQGEDLPDFD